MSIHNLNYQLSVALPRLACKRDLLELERTPYWTGISILSFVNAAEIVRKRISSCVYQSDDLMKIVYWRVSNGDVKFHTSTMLKVKDILEFCSITAVIFMKIIALLINEIQQITLYLDSKQPNQTILLLGDSPLENLQAAFITAKTPALNQLF